MNRIVFNHHRLHFKSLLLSNCLAPAFILGSSISNSNQLGLGTWAHQEIQGPLKANTLAVAIFCLLFLTASGYYIRNNFKSNREMQHFVKWDKKGLSYLIKGLVFHFITLTIVLAFATTAFISNWQSNAAFKWTAFAFSGVCVIISIVSNVFLYMFEWKKYFQIYYPKYQKTDIAEVIKNMDYRKSLKSGKVQTQ